MEPSAPGPTVIAAEGAAREEAARLIRLASPVVVAYLGTVAMGTVDAMMVGRLGTGALAAVTLANTWNFGIVIVALGAARALDPVVAQAHGAGDRRTVGAGLSLGVAMAALLTLPIFALFSFAEPSLALFGQPQELLAPAGSYCRALLLGVPGLLAFAVCRQFTQALGVMRPGTIAVLLANLVNAGLNWVLIYGKLGMPALGVLGSGYATAVAQWFMLAALLFFGRRSFRGHWLGWRAPLAWSALCRLLGIGLALGLQVGLEVWAFLAAGLMMGRLGAVPLAAHAIAMNLATVSFMVPNALGAASATRVGHLFGAGLHWARTARVALGLAVGFMLVPAAAFALAPAALAGLYTPDATVIALAATLLPLAGAFQVFDGTQVVSFGVLRGVGDVHLPSAANLVGYWLVGLPVGWALAFRAGWGARGVWAGLVLALAAVAALLVLRLAGVARAGRSRLLVGPS
ncbi:MAG: MATE family efflux transporter [Acidobacteriia bacterium]|nr:MATE family efflux transporter [Terriglobia bacterium]